MSKGPAHKAASSPTFEAIFDVMSAASVGDLDARVPVPAEPDLENVETRFALALNVLLDDLAVRASKIEQMHAEAMEREVEDRLREQRSLLAAIIDSTDDAVISKTLDGTITTWNHGAQILLGYTPDEIVGQSVYLLVPPGREAEEKAILRSLSLGAVMHLDTMRRRKDGTEVEVSITVSPVRDKTGAVIGISDVERDITERSRAARVLAQAKEAAEAANRELETFSYSVAHDLRAPLRGMNGFAHLLLDELGDSLAPKPRGWLDGIHRNASRMAELIDGLLSLAHVTQTELVPKNVDLSTIARETAAQLSAAEPARELNLEIEPHLYAHADPRLVRVLLLNLFNNAFKFTGKSPAPFIEFGHTGEEFYVRDNGAGFDEAFASKMFMPFRRLHDEAEYPGTGIGLATVQRIVHRHGGRVRARGAPGRGATFYFTLAASPADPG